MMLLLCIPYVLLRVRHEGDDDDDVISPVK